MLEHIPRGSYTISIICPYLLFCGHQGGSLDWLAVLLWIDYRSWRMVLAFHRTDGSALVLHSCHLSRLLQPYYIRLNFFLFNLILR